MILDTDSIRNIIQNSTGKIQKKGSGPTDLEIFLLNHDIFSDCTVETSQIGILGDIVSQLNKDEGIPYVIKVLGRRIEEQHSLDFEPIVEQSSGHDIYPQVAASVNIKVGQMDPAVPVVEQLLLEYTAFERDRRGISRADRAKKDSIDSLRLADFINDEYLLHTLPDRASYLYDEGIYREISPLELETLVSLQVREWGPSAWSKSKENEYIAAIQQRTLLSKTHEQIEEENRSYINFPNGYYDLETYTFHSQGQEQRFFTSALPYEFDEAAQSPQFEEAIHSIFEDDEERIAVFQQLFGYLLTHEIKLQTGFFFLGSGSNGKSLLIKIMSEVIGSENVTNTSLQTLSKPFGYSELLHRKVMFSTENEMKNFDNTENFKAVTGGDSVRLERKHKEAFTTKLTAKLVIALNDMMDTDDVTHGFFRRVFILPFNQQYKEPVSEKLRQPGVHYMDVDLEEKLLNELPGIFNFAIEGLKALRSNDYRLPYSKSCQQALMNYKLSQQPIPYFFKDKFRVNPSGKFLRPNLFGSYESWRASVVVPVRTYSKRQLQTVFENHLKLKGLRSNATKVQGHYYYQGIEQ